MIEKIILNPDENLKPCLLKWSYEKEDYVVDVPDGITRCDLVNLVEEIKRLTQTSSKWLEYGHLQEDAREAVQGKINYCRCFNSC